MNFDDELEKFKAFRVRYLTTLLSPLPHDPAKVHQERLDLEPWRFEALEYAATFESFELALAVREYEKPDSRSWDFCQAQAHEQRKWRKKAEAAAVALESRSIKLSQMIKAMEPIILEKKYKPSDFNV